MGREERMGLREKPCALLCENHLIDCSVDFGGCEDVPLSGLKRKQWK